jgi:hypothetical protein
MTRTRPSILLAFAWAYWDLFHVVRTMWRSALIALMVASIGVFVIAVGPMLLGRDPIGQAIVRQMFVMAMGFLLTPFLLAVHRLVLLGEAPKRYDLDPSRPRFQLFFGWFAVSGLLLSIPAFLDALTAAKDPFYSLARSFADAGPSSLVISARLAAFVMVQHLLVLFPAIAIDAPAATWQNAISDTRSQVWFAVAATMLPFVPLVLLGMLIAPLMRVAPGTLTGVITGMFGLGAMFLVVLTLAAVIASRLYQTVGDRLNTPLRES